MIQLNKVFFCLALLLLFVLATSQTNKEFCHTRNFSFRAGEVIKYKVYYHSKLMSVGAGEVSFTTKYEQYQDRPVFHIVGDGKTYKSYDWFFKVRDKYETYIDTVTFLPLKFVRNVWEGPYKTYNNVNFNHKLGTAVSTNGVFKIGGCVHDVLSSIYFARNIDFSLYKVGDRIPFQMFIDDKIYDLYIKYLGVENIKTAMGTFNCVKFKPLLIKGTLFEGGEKMNVWATNDGNHIPVRIESPVTVGDIRADMVSYSNLRNPLTSFLGKK